MPKITIGEAFIKVEKEESDPKYFYNGWGDGESKFLYWLKNILNKEPYNMDLIKKRMYKDGHLVDDNQQYLRSRKIIKGNVDFMIYNGHWAITGLNDDWHKDGVVYLLLERYDENETKD
jgi:hypothetical protein